MRRKWTLCIVMMAMIVQLFTVSTGTAATTSVDRTAPTTPTKLTLKTRDTGSITFTWVGSKDNVRVSGYHVYRNGKQIAKLYRSLTYIDRNLPQNTTYQYVVRAVDTSGNLSKSSNVLTAKTMVPEAIDTRYGVYYEIFVRAFADSNGDGIGDFNGITQKLDYLNDGNPNTTTDLGIDGIWLMPIHPSPSYHGYDVTDYYGVNPEYGTMNQFKTLLSEAKKRGIKVVIDTIFNHSSSKHPWFEQARSSTNNKYRNWYVWATSGTNTSERSAVGGNAWNWSGNGHYLGAFWSGMPDLNVDNPDVRKELANIGKYWLDIGVDGFRMDAAKHIYDDLASSKLKPETNEKNQKFWLDFRAEIDKVNPNAYMIGEIWDTKEVIAPYLQSYNSAFNFDLAEKIVSAANSGASVDLARTIQLMNATYREASAGKFVDAPFLTNHDQERVMSTLNEDFNKAKLAASMLLTLPGTPYLYYGEEVGMVGTKPDEKIRLPFPWYESGEGPGQAYWRYDWVFSETNKMNALDVQKSDSSSLYNHYRNLIHLRKKEIALHQGDIKPYPLDSYSLESYMRFSKNEKVLVVHNLSDEDTVVTMPAGSGVTTFSKIIYATQIGGKLAGRNLTVPAYTTVFLK